MKVVKIVASDWENASRDKRELSAYRELGADVKVIAKGSAKEIKKECVCGFDVLRFSTRPLGERVPKFINRIIAVFIWAHYIRTLEADVISGHDLFGLFIGYLSNFRRSKKHRAKLIYDSHEFELGRAAERSKINLWFTKRLEHFLIKRCAFSIMVNDSIADEVQRIYGLKNRPVVIRNTPDYWTVDYSVTTDVHRDFCRMIGIREDSFIIMYHGGIIEGRGIVKIINLVALSHNIVGVILGNGEKKYVNSLKQMAIEKGVRDRILFLPAVPLSELWKYVGAANVGMIMAPAICKNHLFSLPNKFFENIQSETPIICPFYPAMKELVDRYNIGLTCDPENIEEIAACVERMRTDSSFYELCKKNLKTAKMNLCWENEKQALITAYKQLEG